MPNIRTEAIPSRLAEARRSAGLTQEQVAERSGLSRTSITRYETGTVSPSPVSLHMLASLYGRSVDWLLGEEDDEPGQSSIEADRELIMNEASLALRTTSKDLSDEAIKSIADFIRFVHAREERERRERQTGG